MTKHKYMGKCKCGAKKYLYWFEGDAPKALIDASPIRTVQTPNESVIMGIPMPKPPCPECDKWMEGAG